MINIRNIDDNECFKLSVVRCSNPENHHPAKITKADKNFDKKLGFKDIKFIVKIRDIHKVEIKNSIGVSVFGCESKEKHPNQKKKKKKKCREVKKKMLIYY